jgi:DNA repair protein RadD
MSTLKPLRAHQQTGMDDLRAAIASGRRRPVLQAATGFGKTVLAAHIAAGAIEKRKRLAFCVPSIGLIDQTFDRFVENGIEPGDMGVIQGSHPWRRPNALIQIATAQTLARRSLPLAHTVLIDECHLQHKVYQQWMLDAPESLFIGLSATPWARGMGKHYDALVQTTPLAELIEGGSLSPFRVFVPAHPDLGGVKIVRGDYDDDALGKAMNRPKLVADIVSTWLARGENRPALCFAVNRAHAAAIYEKFQAAGVACAYVDANTPRDERDQIGRKLGRGDIKVVVNIGCLTTGIDWDVRCIILARPTRSEMLFVQIIGRGLRTADGKADCIVLDHSDTHLTLGMVTDIRRDELCMGTRAKVKWDDEERAMPLPRECNACTALIPAAVKECPECGQCNVRPTGVLELDGQLVTFDGQRSGKADPVLAVLRRMDRASVYAQIKHMQISRKASDGWVSHTFREIFEVWPRGMDGIRPVYPSPEALQFVKDKDRRYKAERRQRDQAEAAHAA